MPKLRWMLLKQFFLGNNLPMQIRENKDFPQQKLLQLPSANVNFEGWNCKNDKIIFLFFNFSSCPLIRICAMVNWRSFYANNLHPFSFMVEARSSIMCPWYSIFNFFNDKNFFQLIAAFCKMLLYFDILRVKIWNEMKWSSS